MLKTFSFSWFYTTYYSPQNENVFSWKTARYIFKNIFSIVESDNKPQILNLFQ